MHPTLVRIGISILIKVVVRSSLTIPDFIFISKQTRWDNEGNRLLYQTHGEYTPYGKFLNIDVPRFLVQAFFQDHALRHQIGGARKP